MSLYLTVGSRAALPYTIEKIDRRVYTLEELCYSLGQCAGILDESILDPALAGWIERDLGLPDLAGDLRQRIGRRTSCRDFVAAILSYAAYQTPEEQEQILYDLDHQTEAGTYEDAIRRAGILAGQGKMGHALAALDRVLENLPALERDMRSLAWLEKGRIYAGAFRFREAADCFREAYSLTHDSRSGISLLAALRLCVSREEWEGYVRDHPDLFELADKALEAVDQAVGRYRAGSDSRTIRRLKQLLREGQEAELDRVLAQKAADLKEALRGFGQADL